MLDEKARRLLVELARLASDRMFTLSDIEVVGAKLGMERWEQANALQQLVDAALVQVVDIGWQYSLHPVTAEYATNKLFQMDKIPPLHTN